MRASSLALMWRRCVRTVLDEANSSAAISVAWRLLGRYRATRSSASLSSSCGGAATPRAGTGGPASTSRISESNVACAVRCLRTGYRLAAGPRRAAGPRPWARRCRARARSTPRRRAGRRAARGASASSSEASIAARSALNERSRRSMAGPARRQPVPFVQQRHGLVGERDAVRLQQPARLVEREAQVARADLGEPVGQAQAMQTEPRILACRQRHAQPRRELAQEALEQDAARRRTRAHGGHR